MQVDHLFGHVSATDMGLETPYLDSAYTRAVQGHHSRPET